MNLTKVGAEADDGGANFLTVFKFLAQRNKFLFLKRYSDSQFERPFVNSTIEASSDEPILLYFEAKKVDMCIGNGFMVYLSYLNATAQNNDQKLIIVSTPNSYVDAGNLQTNWEHVCIVLMTFVLTSCIISLFVSICGWNLKCSKASFKVLLVKKWVK